MEKRRTKKPSVPLKAPAEFRHFGIQFIEGFACLGTTPEEIFLKVQSSFRGEARLRLKTFLGDIAADRISDANLTRLWNSTEANVVFYEHGGLRTFLKQARDRL